jgi:hypothetical protein
MTAEAHRLALANALCRPWQIAFGDKALNACILPQGLFLSS